MNRLSSSLSGFLFAAFCLTVVGGEPQYRIAEEIPLDTVPSWFPVGFSLLTHGDDQYAAYYNAKHQMVVAKRRLDQVTWQKVELPSKIGWDSHNYITMAIDGVGNLHLAGNMHCVPLIYFCTERPGNIATFKRLPMTGKKESRCTYPRFINDAEGNLLFMYRDGGSGVIVLDEETLETTSRKVTVQPEYARELQRPTIDFKGIRVKLANDLVLPPDDTTKYVLRWETLGANHDRPRQPPLPPASELKLIRLTRN